MIFLGRRIYKNVLSARWKIKEDQYVCEFLFWFRSFGLTDVTLPKHILKILGIENGHRSNVTFIVENGEVKIVNSAAYAMNNLKKAKDKEAA